MLSIIENYIQAPICGPTQPILLNKANSIIRYVKPKDKLKIRIKESSMLSISANRPIFESNWHKLGMLVARTNDPNVSLPTVNTGKEFVKERYDIFLDRLTSRTKRDLESNRSVKLNNIQKSLTVVFPICASLFFDDKKLSQIKRELNLLDQKFLDKNQDLIQKIRDENKINKTQLMSIIKEISLLRKNGRVLNI